MKDYITAAKGDTALKPEPPFNIKTDSVLLSNFQKDDAARLFAQRTEETGQQITQEAVTAQGLQQITKYRDTIDANAPAYLVIFDRRSESKKAAWDERLTWTQENGITAAGC